VIPTVRLDPTFVSLKYHKISHTPTNTERMGIEAHPDSASYSNSGFGNRMGWGSRPVLLLIDVCKAYWTPGSPLDVTAHAPSVEAPAVMRRLVAAARAAGVPVVWTAVEYTDSEMRDAGLFWLKSKNLNVWQVGDTRGFDKYVEGLEPAKGDLMIKKKYPSAFFGTTLSTDLTVMKADTVVLCGVSTSGCVRASTLDAMQYGFRPMVSSPVSWLPG
jgi:nicotinamidase-related amidase